MLVSGVQQSGSVIHCQLRIGTCHLPLQGLNHTLLSLLIFNALQKEFGVESRNEALCAQGGKTGRTGLQIVIFRSWFYEPNSCISSYLERHWNPSWGWLFLMSGRKLQATNRNLLEKYVLDCMYSPSSKSYIYCPSLPPPPLWGSFSELSEVLSPRLQSSFCPK